MITVVLADDHGIVRKGIKLLLSNRAEIDIIGEAADGKKALELIETLKPNVLITDISMPELSGIELTKEVTDKFPDTHILILSVHFDTESILECFECGALAYLPKNANEEELIGAIIKIAQGEVYYTKSVVEILGSSIIKNSSPGKSLKSKLTTREKEILKELINGATNKEIATKLFVSVRTVDAHRRNIMKKLDVKNSAQLVKISIEMRLV
jgi:DNA-binding NarL/FixJ family response regulator